MLLPQAYLRHFISSKLPPRPCSDFTNMLRCLINCRIIIIIIKAHQRANNILRRFMSGNVTLLVRAFVVYVRPVLVYNSITWSPHLKQDIMTIEKVQRRFTKTLRRYRNLSYTDRLIKCALSSLELRRTEPRRGHRCFFSYVVPSSYYFVGTT